MYMVDYKYSETRGLKGMDTHDDLWELYCITGAITIFSVSDSVILLPAHPASFAHNIVSGMQSFYSSESQDGKVLQTCR